MSSVICPQNDLHTLYLFFPYNTFLALPVSSLYLSLKAGNLGLNAHVTHTSRSQFLYSGRHSMSHCIAWLLFTHGSPCLRLSTLTKRRLGVMTYFEKNALQKIQNIILWQSKCFKMTSFIFPIKTCAASPTNCPDFLSDTTCSRFSHAHPITHIKVTFPW